MITTLGTIIKTLANYITTFDLALKTKVVARLRLAQFILAVIIFTVAALMPSDLVPSEVPDYGLHFVGNVLLFLSASVAVFGRMKLVLLILLLIPYSLMVELSQWFAPTRHVDTHDMLANVIGLVCGFIMVHLLEWLWNTAKKNAPATKPNQK